MESFPESDWKKLRSLRDGAIQKFCVRALSEIQRMADHRSEERDAHEAYLALYRHVVRRDKQLARLFNDWRRSTAEITLAKWFEAGLVTADELARFSQETRDHVEVIVAIGKSTDA